MNIKVIKTGDFIIRELAYPVASNLENSLNAIRKLGVKNIGISSLDGWNENSSLEFLKYHQWITGIEFQVSGLDISSINYAKEITYLNLAGSIYKGMVDLGNFKKLEELLVGYSFGSFKGLHEVTSLRLFECYAWPYENLDYLKTNTNIEWLELFKSRKLTSLKGISHLRNLYRLKIYSAPKLTDVDDLGAIADSIKKLHFELVKGVKNFEVLDKLYNLENLFIYESAPIHSIDFLKKLKHYKYAYIGTEVKDGNVAYLEEKGIEYKKLKKYTDFK